MARFDVQARVLDLLGLQQIANCPTAISELFKNAWDAYAEKIMLDVYPDGDQALLWDNGTGMTENELLNRWLVIGAAGKEALPTSIKPPKGMAPRPIQGEKGIGRLAISTLGDTLLLISRSQKPQNPKEPFVALLINWNIVQNEFLRLSDLEIPHFTFTHIEELATGIISDMAQDLRRSLLSPNQDYAWDKIVDKEKRHKALELRHRVLHQLETLAIDITSLRRTFQEWTKEHGTIFCISHLKDEFHQYVQRPIRDEGGEGPHNELVQLLSNFRNTFHFDGDDSGDEIRFEADIRRWDSHSCLLSSLFQESAAFEPDDLRFYDHRIDVKFDENGRFEGRLDIYGKPVELPTREAQVKRQIYCGPFRLRLWYYQDKNDSRLAADQWTLISKKLNLFGGLMIYRDGLRVLPYGRPEFDWLRMEERRSKGAGYYFFSYRRLFGYVSINRHENSQLIDKAGREGLIINNAYRGFRETLEDFFIYLARHHFRKDTPFYAAKEDISAERKKIEQERKRAADLRKQLREEAADKLLYIREKAPEQLELAFREATKRLEGIEQTDVSSVTDTLLRFENRVAQVAGSARFAVPRNLSIVRDKELRRLKHDHSVAFDTFSHHCNEVRQSFQTTVQSRFPEAQLTVSRQRAVEQAYALAMAQLGKAHKALRTEFETQVGALDTGLDEIYTQQRARVEHAFSSATIFTDAEGANTGEAIEVAEIIGAINEAAGSSVELLREQQERLASYLTGYFGEAKDALISAQTSEIEKLREEVDRNLELVQLGLAVEIIDHDLNKLFSGIRASLARLHNLLRNTPRATHHVEDLRSSFIHLEQRFRQMSPIYRGSYRVKTEIDGKRIFLYCRDFLDHQIRSVNIKLEASEAFLTFRIREVEAVIFPVFINLIDNAVYWLREMDGERRILLDRRGDVITICDTGPGIHPTAHEDVFEPFLTTKPGGRGLGLYIARANLQRYGHSIWVTNDPAYRSLSGACLCIQFHEDVIFSE
jgi:signal transduction histidine kinase